MIMSSEPRLGEGTTSNRPGNAISFEDFWGHLALDDKRFQIRLGRHINYCHPSYGGA